MVENKKCFDTTDCTHIAQTDVLTFGKNEHQLVSDRSSPVIVLVLLMKAQMPLDFLLCAENNDHMILAAMAGDDTLCFETKISSGDEMGLDCWRHMAFTDINLQQLKQEIYQDLQSTMFTLFLLFTEKPTYYSTYMGQGTQFWGPSKLLAELFHGALPSKSSLAAITSMMLLLVIGAS